ncbi:uncharacterized protein LOC106367640 [Brassica napus]|uniref:uncharacterized protein LOC106367640 n=1 Tax=Brassica napus TaxID=3708 RepID=UPI00207A4244|nr:uncharacterized protein LOC106367640 [Brassica napus]
MAALKLIKQGAKVAIGNGRKTKLWEEQWLGSKPTFARRTTSFILPQYRQIVTPSMTVVDLMNVPGKEWNRELIESIFPENIKEQILATNIQGSHGEDTYYWEYTKTGHYTVKSGYWVQQSINKPDQSNETVDRPSLDGLFQQIWKMNTSPKVHHFLWKCLSDSLPAAANMRNRHIAKDGSCGRYAMEDETINHILFTCPYARLIWALSPIHAPKNGVLSDSLYANLARVMNLKHQDPTEKVYDDLVPWLLWRIWKNRNEFLFKGIDYTPPSTVSKAREDMEEWLKRKEEEKTVANTAPRSSQHHRWKPPPTSWIKCNSDGAWQRDRHQNGMGWISRNEHGKLLWAGMKSVQGLRSPAEAEAEGIKWAMHSMSSLGYKQVIFETDALLIVKMVAGTEEIWPNLKPIIMEIQNCLTGNASYRLEYYPRESNKAADKIANEAFSLQNHVSKLYSIVPVWLKSVFETDLSTVVPNFMG